MNNTNFFNIRNQNITIIHKFSPIYAWPCRDLGKSSQSSVWMSCRAADTHRTAVRRWIWDGIPRTVRTGAHSGCSPELKKLLKIIDKNRKYSRSERLPWIRWGLWRLQPFSSRSSELERILLTTDLQQRRICKINFLLQTILLLLISNPALNGCIFLRGQFLWNRVELLDETCWFQQLKETMKNWKIRLKRNLFRIREEHRIEPSFS